MIPKAELLGCLNHKLFVLGQQIVHIHLEVFRDFSVSVLGTGKGNAVLVPGNHPPVDPQCIGYFLLGQLPLLPPEEFRKVTVNVTVEEKGKVPPTSGKEEGKNNSGDVYKRQRENFVSYPDNVLVTRLTATDGGTLDFDVRVEPDEEKGGSQNKPEADSYARTFDKKVSDNAIAIDGQLTDCLLYTSRCV